MSCVIRTLSDVSNIEAFSKPTCSTNSELTGCDRSLHLFQALIFCDGSIEKITLRRNATGSASLSYQKMGRRGKERDKVEVVSETLAEVSSRAQEVLENGAAKMNGSLDAIAPIVEKQENIFLFIPNIIGIASSCSSRSV